MIERDVKKMEHYRDTANELVREINALVKSKNISLTEAALTAFFYWCHFKIRHPDICAEILAIDVEMTKPTPGGPENE